jgi:hypothetical protein
MPPPGTIMIDRRHTDAARCQMKLIAERILEAEAGQIRLSSEEGSQTR